MLAALLLAAALPAQSSIDAERAFAAMAQTQGQWTAFRAYAAPDAITFAPKAVNAQALLRTLKNPPPGLMWWPGRSWVACDGSLAINTGPWIRRGGKATGTFTTVWQRQGDGGWKWLLDHGRETPGAMPASERPPVARASCRNLGKAASASPDPTSLSPDILYQADNLMPSGRRVAFEARESERLGGGASRDGSLVWRLDGLEGGEEGAHLLRLWLWDGRIHRLVLQEVTGVKTGLS
jgi:hypothetical protein